MLHLLKTFNTIWNIGDDRQNVDPNIEYALRINHAGRNILEGSRDDARTLPLLVWPILLAREMLKQIWIYILVLCRTVYFEI